MLEVFVLVPRKRSALLRFFTYLSLACTIVLIVFSCISVIFVCAAAAFAILWYVLQFKQYKEYEYSYFDGEVRFAKILNKNRRKRLQIFSMDEVIQIAPAGDRSVSKYESDLGVKKIDYTSGDSKVPYYEMIVKDDEGITLIKYEPDDKYLDAVCVKYGQKVIRRSN